MKSHKGTILVVEDDMNQRSIVKTILVKDGFYVEDASTGKKATIHAQASTAACCGR